MTKEYREKKATRETRDRVEENARTAQETFDEAARVGQRISEQAFECWYKMLSGAGWPNQLERLNEAAGNFVPLATRNWDELFSMWRASSHAGTELLGKTIQSATAPFANGNQEKLLELWAAALKTTQHNIGAATHFTTRAMDSWARFVRGQAERAAQTSS